MICQNLFLKLEIYDGGGSGVGGSGERGGGDGAGGFFHHSEKFPNLFIYGSGNYGGLWWLCR